jgi:hypothetical protein
VSRRREPGGVLWRASRTRWARVLTALHAAWAGNLPIALDHDLAGDDAKTSCFSMKLPLVFKVIAAQRSGRTAKRCQNRSHRLITTVSHRG